MRTLFTAFIATTIALALSLSLLGQAPPQGKGKGGPPKNLKILTAETYREAMQSFTAALGVDCNYCHVADRSSDENPKKDIARMMLTMSREINAKWTDGKQHVRCYTCHRGATTPLTEPPGGGDKK